MQWIRLCRNVSFFKQEPIGLATVTLGLLLVSQAVLVNSSPARAATLASGPPKQTSELNSTLPYHEVRIPFTLSDGAVILQANISGTTVDCLLDTGSSGIVFPDTLGIPGTSVGALVRTTDAAGNVVKCQPSVVENIELGGFAIHNARTVVLNTTASAQKPEGLLAHAVILGSQAFKDAVITVDYAKHELVLHDIGYDCTSQVGGDAVILNFRLANASSAGYGLPVVSAHIGGRPARLVLDTGFTGVEFGLQNSYVARNSDLKGSPKLDVNTSEISGSTKVKYMKSVFASLDTPTPIYIRGNALLMSADLHDIDGCLGAPVLSQFRVTFDFPRRRVLLEPYDQEYRNVLAGKKPRTRISIGDLNVMFVAGSEVEYAAGTEAEINGVASIRGPVQVVTVGDVTFALPPESSITFGSSGAVVVAVQGYPKVTIGATQSPSLSDGLRSLKVGGSTFVLLAGAKVRIGTSRSGSIDCPGQSPISYTVDSPANRSPAANASSENPDCNSVLIHADGTVTFTKP